MRAESHFSITLPGDIAEFVEAQVRSGTFDSVSDVVSAGVSALLEKDAALDRWLREEVLAGHAEFLDDPSKAVAADDILARIKDRRLAETR